MSINLHKFERILKARGEEAAMSYVWRRMARDDAKKANARKRDALAVSMLHRGRTRTEGEYWTEYGFILPEDILFDYDPEVGEWETYLSLTEAEVNEWIGENMFVRIYSDYDCTGRPFTTGITWHRNPCGLISYQHHMGIDI